MIRLEIKCNMTFYEQVNQVHLKKKLHMNQSCDFYFNIEDWITNFMYKFVGKMINESMSIFLGNKMSQ